METMPRDKTIAAVEGLNGAEETEPHLIFTLLFTPEHGQIGELGQTTFTL